MQTVVFGRIGTVFSPCLPTLEGLQGHDSASPHATCGPVCVYTDSGVAGTSGRLGCVTEFGVSHGGPAMPAFQGLANIVPIENPVPQRRKSLLAVSPFPRPRGVPCRRCSRALSVLHAAAAGWRGKEQGAAQRAGRLPPLAPAVCGESPDRTEPAGPDAQPLPHLLD